LKKEDDDEEDLGDGEPMIGPKLPPEFEVNRMIDNYSPLFPSFSI
jgi:hypothetical protein